MEAAVKPGSEAELAQLVAQAEAPFEIIGTGTKRGLGRPVQAARTLDMSAFAEIAAYEPEELILEAGAGTRLAEIEALIAARGQQLAFEPPDLSRLLGSPHSGTLGGLMACNLAGPRRIKAGAARDHVLGIRGVSGRGEVFKAGARVVKNVTGYDLPKLLTGSYGTLAALTSITVKVLPRPETEETILVEGLDDTAAVSVMSLAMQSACEVSGAAHVPGEGTYPAARGDRGIGRRPARCAGQAAGTSRSDPGGQGLWHDLAAHSRRSGSCRHAGPPGLAPLRHAVGRARRCWRYCAGAWKSAMSSTGPAGSSGSMFRLRRMRRRPSFAARCGRAMPR